MLLGGIRDDRGLWWYDASRIQSLRTDRSHEFRTDFSAEKVSSQSGQWSVLPASLKTMQLSVLWFQKVNVWSIHWIGNLLDGVLLLNFSLIFFAGFATGLLPGVFVHRRLVARSLLWSCLRMLKSSTWDLTWSLAFHSLCLCPEVTEVIKSWPPGGQSSVFVCDSIWPFQIKYRFMMGRGSTGASRWEPFAKFVDLA